MIALAHARGNEPLMGLAVDSGSLAFIDKRYIADPNVLADPCDPNNFSGSLVLSEPLNLTISPHGNVDDADGLLNIMVDEEDDG